MVYQKYDDSAHGWLRVPIFHLDMLGISDDISHYSYKKGRYAYLEEDGDLTTFFDAYVDKYGSEPEIKYNYSDGRSRIRDFPFYS